MADTTTARDHSANLVTSSLLSIKLFAPQVSNPQELLPRPRLVERLQQGLARKLTLVSAPAGYGKTMLLAKWIPQSGRPVAWLSLDETDNELSRFLTYFIAALQTLKADFAHALLGTLQSPELPPIENLMTTLVNEIIALGMSALVLDDYHLIQAQTIHVAIALLLNHLPPNLHLILLSRADPPLPLARLRARSQLNELRAADLRFTADESIAFFHQIKALPLPAAQIKELETRTEGWGAGLQLAALSLQGLDKAGVERFIHDFTGSHYNVFDYLVEEVLQQQPAALYRFLLYTSILTRLCGPLCDAVLRERELEAGDVVNSQSSISSLQSPTPNSPSRSILEQIEHANLFVVPLDNRRYWYRYHHLFAELLRTRLEQAYPDLIGELHQRASVWYEQNGLIIEAIEHALAAAAYDQVADLIGRMGINLFSIGPFQHTLTKWLTSLPSEFVRMRPKLCLIHAWLLLNQRDLAAALRWLKEAEQALQHQKGDNSLEDRNTQGEIIALRALITAYSSQIDLDLIDNWVQAALACLHPQNSSYRGVVFGVLGTLYIHRGDVLAAEAAFTEAANFGRAADSVYVTVVATFHQINMQRAQGALGRAMGTGQQLVAWISSRDAASAPVTGNIYAVLADLLREQNDLETALSYATKAIERSTQNVYLLVSSYLALARIHHAQGHPAEAFAAIRQLVQLVGQRQIPWIHTLLPAVEAQLHLLQGNLPAALAWSLDAEWEKKLLHPLPNSHVFVYAYEYGRITQLQVRLAQGCTTADLNLLRAVVTQLEQEGQRAQSANLLWLKIKTDVLLALAYAAMHDQATALATLERALRLARLEGFIRIFVDEGAPMAQLLAQAFRAGLMPDYTSELLAAFPDFRFAIDDLRAETPLMINRKSQSANLIEPLSIRELEVLQLMAQGLTNPEIAQKIYISVQTVKVHTRNIFGKLGVNDRKQAGVKARALGLLPGLNNG